ncbi:MAG: MATE family efflux transporter [Oscillospiraceae bacterium]
MRKILKRIFEVNRMLTPAQNNGELEPSVHYYKNMYQMAWPSALEAVLVSLIGSVDLIMVGGLGTASIAAVAITNQPKFILLAMIFSLNVGVTAIAARRRGSDDEMGANRCLRQSLIISLVMSFLMGLIGFIFARPILSFAGADPEFLELAIQYFQIIMVSIVFTGVSLTINAAQRGAGNTKISMKTNLIANAVNLVLNYFLINGIWIFPKLGVRGAAIATAVGSLVGCAMSIKSVLNKGQFLSMAHKVSWKFDKKTMKAIISISGSAMVEQVFMRIGFFAYAKIVAGLGTVAFATHQICMNIINLSFSIGDGLGIASSSLVGQSLGKKRPDEAIVYGKTGQRIAFLVSTVLFFIFLFGGKFLVSLFSKDEQILALGAIIMIIIAFCTHAQTSQVVVSGCLRGAGDTKFVALTSLLSIGLLRPILTYILCFPVGLGLVGAWVALFVDQMLRLLLSFKRFSGGKWTKIDI